MAIETRNPFSTLLTDPVRNFRFLVDFLPHDTSSTNAGRFQPKGSVGFVSVDGLAVATESIAYREGGYNTTYHQIPGQTAFQPISFSRGVILGTDQHQRWMKQLFAVVSGFSQSGVGSDFRCDIDITVLSHPNPANFDKASGTSQVNTTADTQYRTGTHASLKFRVYNAWINSLGYSGLSAGSNDLMVESMTVVHEGWELTWASDYGTTAPDPDYSTVPTV